MLSRKFSKTVARKYAFLLESQHWPHTKLKEYQWTKLQDLLLFAKAHVPYYRDLFEKQKINISSTTTVEDIKQIPILTRETIQSNLDALMSEKHDRKDLFLNSTGGSTGQPLNFHQDINFNEWHEAAMLRAWKDMVGQKFTDLEAVVWGAERDIGKGLSIKRILYSVLREKKLALNTFDLDPKLIRRFLLVYNILRPPILRGYSSSLYFLANFISDNQIRIHYPSAIISSAEMMWPEMRKTVETVFRAKVFDSYGSREVSQIATECEAHNGLHVVMENQYVEVENKAIIVTNLNNYAMPFIRYKIGDKAERIVSGSCTCGRHSERLLGITGRESEMISLDSGKTIHGEYFTHLFYGEYGVKAFEVVFRKKENKLVIRCDEISDSTQVAFRGQIYKDFRLQNVEFENLESVNKTPTGKYKFITVIDE
jgi:phenylacetate-CoA ligase